MAFLILVIGDLHIPDRALDIPAKFKKLLSPGKIGQTLCLGNLTDKHTYEYLRSIAPDLKIVKGRFDGFTLVSTEPDLLLAEANKLDVDVLCWGGTHRFDAFEYMDKFFVNPGSATGAYTTGWTKEGEEMVPSFCLMDVSLILLLRPPDVLLLFSEQEEGYWMEITTGHVAQQARDAREPRPFAK
ncbi:vacuolar protein sorting [Apiospora hydei]|uniref:Vacuolar protein sorting n=1 Tax=Apiospora hydei TaxID=1337664 RepID=A0ABR1XB05_9PEZI